MRTAIITLSFLIIECLSTMNLSAQPDFPFTGYENNPVLSPSNSTWDEGCTFLASPLYYDGIYYLYYSGSEGLPINTEISLGYAISVDGYNYVKEDDPILQADGTGFDSHSIGLSIVIREDEEFWMYYNGSDQIPTPGPGKHIGFATADDPAGPWSRLDDPVLSAGSDSEWDAGCAEPQSVIKVDSGYMMYYFGIDEIPINDEGCIGMAFSTDGQTWEKYDDPSTQDPPYSESDPILMPGEEGSWDDFTILGCGVIKTAVGFEMFYAGIHKISLNMFEYGIGYATSEDGIVWEKQPEDPFTYESDPYALVTGNPLLEEPKVLLNADSTEYLLYYDYGFQYNEGEIGMASAPALSSGLPQPGSSENQVQCTVYPNPTDGTINLSLRFENPGSFKIEVINTSGNRVYQNQIDHNTSMLQKQLDLTSNPAGIYLLRISSKSSILNKRIVIY